jgi:antitoxin (DNA-binding transcriptional repressor) of toxin-antitoxin stability system
MISATIFEAKANLSSLIKQTQKGEVVTIASGRQKTPVARLIAVHPAKKKRLGALDTPGFVLSEKFFEPLPEDERRLWDAAAE